MLNFGAWRAAAGMLACGLIIAGYGEVARPQNRADEDRPLGWCGRRLGQPDVAEPLQLLIAGNKSDNIKDLHFEPRLNHYLLTSGDAVYELSTDGALVAKHHSDTLSGAVGIAVGLAQ